MKEAEASCGMQYEEVWVSGLHGRNEPMNDHASLMVPDRIARTASDSGPEGRGCPARPHRVGDTHTSLKTGFWRNRGKKL
jgi:hypothetical protein